MRLMIASDIHGSAYYCEQMLNAYNKEEADKLLLLGDILYHGPRNDLPMEYSPKKVMAMLNEIKEEILCVRGNCDTEVDQMVLDFPVLLEYGFFYDQDKMFYITHGHKYNPENLPMLKKGDILLTGHTHIPAFERYEDYIYVNPGSVSIPKNESVHSYIIYEDGCFTFKDLDRKIYMEHVI